MKPAQGIDTGHVVIAGHGFVAWLVAASLVRQVETLSVIPVDGSSDWDGAYASLPLRPDDLLGELGISELDLLIKHAGSYSLGLVSDAFTLPYGPVGIDFRGSRFHQHWLLDPQNPFFSYSPAFVALKAGRFAPPVPQNAIGTLQHELARTVDIASLTQALRAQAIEAGVHLVDSTLQSVECSASRDIIAIVDQGGKTLSGDWYIDASGPVRPVAEAQAVDWQAAGRPGRLDVSTVTSRDPLRPETRCEHRADGWRVAHRCQSTGFDISADWSNDGTYNWRPGHQVEPWSRNCLSLGFAACQTLSVSAWHSSALMRSIRRLMDNLPDKQALQSSRNLYNRQTVAEYGELQALAQLFEHSADPHIKLDRDLSRRIDLFRKRGLWDSGDATLLDDCTWINALFALGIQPEATDLLSQRWPHDERRQQLFALNEAVTRVTQSFPRLEDYLAAARNAVEAASA
ncbi:MAG: tryptophan 7-halogenase [Pseudomonadota bacterium]